MEAHDVLDEGGLDGSDTVASLGFEWCSHQLKTMTRRGTNRRGQKDEV
jgi:hypothetical protein